MIDWLTVCIPVDEAVAADDWTYRAGYTLYARPGGEVERVVDRWLDIKGTFEAGVRARLGSKGLWVSGNPTKFLTGQNVHGAMDAFKSCAAVVRSMSAAIGADVAGGLAGARLSRVDVTESYDLGRVERVREVLRVISLAGRARHQGRSHTAHQTVYFGQHSRRHAVKVYAKADELAEHPPMGLPLAVYHDLMEQAQGLLRVEVTIRGQQLRDDGVEGLMSWKGSEMAREQWARYWNRVELSEGAELASDEVLALPRRLRTTYELWAAGRDVYELMGRATAYRHRRELLAATGGQVDVFVLRPRAATADIAERGVLSVLRELKPWAPKGRLAEWCAQAA